MALQNTCNVTFFQSFILNALIWSDPSDLSFLNIFNLSVLPVLFGFDGKEAYSLHAHSDIGQVVTKCVGEAQDHIHILSNLRSSTDLKINKYNHCKIRL